MDQALRGMLIAVARNQQTTTYSEVAITCGLEVREPELARRLDEISTHEHCGERPLLSVVVVHQDGDRMPGAGFFRLARELGVQTRRADNIVFFAQELRRCWELWGANRD